MKKQIQILILSLALPVCVAADTLKTKSFIIEITHSCEEGCVSCDKISYLGRSKKTGESMALRGRTLHTIGSDGTTPSRFQGYRFTNGSIVYSVGSDGTLTIMDGDRLLVKEQGKWSFQPAEQDDTGHQLTIMQTEQDVACNNPKTPIPNVPNGKLGFPLGTYLTIEGMRPKQGFFSSMRIVVEKVNGKVLNKPVSIIIPNVIKPWLPENEIIILNGFETGRMVGVPPAILKINNGLDPLDRAFTDWHFQNEFVITSSVKPNSIKFKSRNY